MLIRAAASPSSAGAPVLFIYLFIFFLSERKLSGELPGNKDRLQREGPPPDVLAVAVKVQVRCRSFLAASPSGVREASHRPRRFKSDRAR